MSDHDLIRRGDALAAAANLYKWSIAAGEELEAAIRALPPAKQDDLASGKAVTVGVKPLVWRSNGKGRICADTPFGLYEIEHGRYGMRLLHSGSFMQDDLQGIDAAKAAAQADYEARILAALEPVSAPDPATIREAALREALAVIDGMAALPMTENSYCSACDDARAGILALIPKGAADDR